MKNETRRPGKIAAPDWCNSDLATDGQNNASTDWLSQERSYRSTTPLRDLKTADGKTRTTEPKHHPPPGKRDKNKRISEYQIRLWLDKTNKSSTYKYEQIASKKKSKFRWRWSGELRQPIATVKLYEALYELQGHTGNGGKYSVWGARQIQGLLMLSVRQASADDR